MNGICHAVITTSISEAGTNVHARDSNVPEDRYHHPPPLYKQFGGFR